MGVFTFVCRSSGGEWSAKQLKGDLEASANCTYTLQRMLVQVALSSDSSGGVQSSFSYVLPDSAVFQKTKFFSSLSLQIKKISFPSIKTVPNLYKVENLADSTDDEIKSFHRSSVSKAAEMAAGFANALAGLSLIEIDKRTGGMLDSLHSEGVHRLSEMCCIVVSQLLILGKSVISNTNKTQVGDEDIVKIEWPNDSIEKAKIIRRKTQTMNGYLEDVSISFLTGISDIAEAYAAATKGGNEAASSGKLLIQEKVDLFSENLRVNQTTAIGRVKDGLQYLAYLVVSTSMPPAAS